MNLSNTATLILAGKDTEVTTDHDTLKDILNACCQELKATMPPNRNWRSPSHHWDSMVSNYIKFAMNNCPSKFAVASAVSLAIVGYKLEFIAEHIECCTDFNRQYGDHISDVAHNHPEKHSEWAAFYS